METASYDLTSPLDLALTLRPLRRGFQDPTLRIVGGEVWRATRTPLGPATARLAHDGDRLTVTAWGPGARWATDAAPDLAGLYDDADRLTPRHDIVRDLKRRLRGLRLTRSRAVVETLIPSILEQKVTGLEARRAYAALVRAYGEPAPGPAPLLLPPEPARLAVLPYHAFHRFGIERRRADTLRRACAHARRLEEAAEMPLPDAMRRLMAVDGIGPWTAGEVARLALGDPDAISVGDYHLPSLVTWSLAGERRGSDARMLELLEPYRGQRGRVVRLLEAGAPWPARRGPRMAPRSIAAI